MLITAGCSSARLECLLWEQEVVSSNLAIPTNQKKATQSSGFFFCHNYSITTIVLSFADSIGNDDADNNCSYSNTQEKYYVTQIHYTTRDTTIVVLQCYPI